MNEMSWARPDVLLNENASTVLPLTSRSIAPIVAFPELLLRPTVAFATHPDRLRLKVTTYGLSPSFCPAGSLTESAPLLTPRLAVTPAPLSITAA